MTIIRFVTATVTPGGARRIRQLIAGSEDGNLDLEQLDSAVVRLKPRSLDEPLPIDHVVPIDTEELYSSEPPAPVSSNQINPLHDLQRRNNCPVCPASAGVANNFGTSAGRSGEGIPCCPRRKVS